MFILKQNFCDILPCTMSILMLTDVPPSDTERQAWQLFSVRKFNYGCKCDNGATFPSFNWICIWHKQPSFSTIWVMVVQGAILCPCCELVNSWLSAEEPAIYRISRGSFMTPTSYTCTYTAGLCPYIVT